MIEELSIIIPTLNEEKFLPKLLSSIVEQEYEGKLQVVVVDGNSADGTIKIANTFNKSLRDLEIIKSRRGVSLQRNIGANKSKYKYLLFLDADIILPKNFLNNISQKVVARDKFLIYVMHIPVRFNLFDYFFISPLVVIAFVYQFFSPILSGSFMLTTKKNHQEIGGFTEGVELGEDLDYCERSYKSGTKYIFYLFPWVQASTRRLRKEGRLRLLYMWISGYFYVKKYGPIYDASKFGYIFGKYDVKE